MGKQTWNQHVVKQKNKSLVLQIIKQNAPISRANIATKTGLNKGTVSSLVNELIKEDIIYESGLGQSSGGRRPFMLLFNKSAGYTIGIDLGVDYILGILTDLKGDVFHQEFLQLECLEFEFVHIKLTNIIETLISHAPDSTYGIVGIGIGVPGTITKNGEIILAPNLNWKNIQLKQILKKQFKVPIIIENEANAGAYGEKKSGAGIESDHIIYVSISIGIGVGMFLNGKLYRGYNGFAGELGHMTIHSNGKKCMCGRKGCWELYASEKALKDYIKNVPLYDNINEYSLEDVIRKTKEGNDLAKQSFDYVGKNLSIGLDNIINIFNPKQIVIGGRIAIAKQWLERSIKKHLFHETRFQQKDLVLNFSELGVYSNAIGSAEFAIDNFINNYLYNNSKL